jgi:DNA repair protein RecN (Recombination protein N)
VEDLLALRARLQEQVERVLHFDEDLKRAQEAREALLRQALEAGRALSEARRAAIPDIEAELDALLAGVGIPNGRASMAWEALPDPAPSGLDQVSLLFSANKGIAPAPLKQVASGGEFSRLMLCIKYVLAAKTDLPTIIFDEIDTGVSGEVALRVGAMMEDMARGHQLVAITHLPQIASKGDTHYFVYKDHGAAKTISRIRKLTDEERVREIAQMIGGLHPTETAYQSAKELMGR